MRLLYILSSIILLNSCTSDCGNLQQKSDAFYKEYMFSYQDNQRTYNQLRVLIDSLIILNSKSMLLKKYVGYTIKPLKYSDDGINKQNKALSYLLRKISCNELIINYEMSNDSIPLVLIYPANLDKYATQQNCPSFSAELIYSPSRKSFHSESSNWIFYKMNDFWYIRTTEATL
jgi:hypothetical protein